MSWQEMIVAICVALAAAAVLRNLLVKKGSSCGTGGCGSCGSRSACSSDEKSTPSGPLFYDASAPADKEADKGKPQEPSR